VIESSGPVVRKRTTILGETVDLLALPLALRRSGQHSCHRSINLLLAWAFRRSRPSELVVARELQNRRDSRFVDLPRLRGFASTTASQAKTTVERPRRLENSSHDRFQVLLHYRSMSLSSKSYFLMLLPFVLVACEPSVTYGSTVFGEADGPEVDLQAQMPARFDVTVSSDDWHLPGVLIVDIERSPGVDVTVPDALDHGTGDDDSTAWFFVDLHDPPFEYGIARTFVVELSANQDVADVHWHVTASMDVIADAVVEASYDVEISRAVPPQ